MADVDIAIARPRRIVTSLATLLILTAAALPALAQQGVAKAPRPGRGPNAPRALPAPATDQDFRPASPEQVELGRLLFFDKVLSGNRDISCATCHHPMAGTGDGLSLPFGTAARGLSVARSPGDPVTGVHERVPRNAPAVFNLGAFEFTTMFHDGRVTADPNHPSGFVSPAGVDLPQGLDSALAAQAMFPVTSGTEMAGREGENAVADASAAGQLAGPGGVWDLLTRRLQGISEYVDLFRAAYVDVNDPEDITFVHAANAIASFEGTAWRADDSPFDRFLRGNRQAMSLDAQKGMRLFYGAAQCSSCHSGTFQTDHGFHSIGMAQIGPGKGDGPDGREDHGRERETGDAADRFRFRTPSLRNVTLTGPYGHGGAHGDLESVLRQHLEPYGSLEGYDRTRAVLPPRDDLDALDFVVQDDAARRVEIAASSEMPAVSLTGGDIRLLIEFLHALTDPSSLDLRADVPMRVPSGEPVAD